ncbi:hypothetical protein [Herbidospora sp. NBRC 101105]|uniref:hypothetical protein n=1 Tax=Herbidospora sp. NBRC 101105 TaxID=3032195 RepID=UPI0024A49CC5|nr:hypothetical protein [Herbidospora sp. NBRC 101105]GLX92351.1 oxidoreductase [Herbidospora sp. NBRC 101105]
MELLPADLNIAEKKIVAAFPVGAPVDLTRLFDRRVRADVIAAVLFGACDLPRGARPALRVTGARITEELVLEAGAITAPVSMTGCDFEGGINLADATAVTIRLHDCRIAFLYGSDLRTQGDLEITDGSAVMGPIDLQGARIGGDLRVSKVHLHPGEKTAVYLSRARIEGGLFVRDSLVCGQLRVISAHVGGLFTARGSDFRPVEVSAIHAERVKVGESVFVDRGFRATGRIYLRAAEIGGGIGAQHSRIAGTSGECVNITRAAIGRNVYFHGAELNGGFDGSGARVGGDIDLDKTVFAEDSCVDFSFAEARAVRVRFAEGPDSLNLEGAKFGVIEDDRDAWPRRIRLEGCAYGAIRDDGGIGVRDRLTWLDRDEGGFSPHPFEQLSAVYRARGDEAAARRVALERHRRRRRTLTAGGRAMSWFSEVTVGFGYRTWLAGIWLAALLATGATIFSVWPPAAVDPKTPRHFEPVVYTLDLLLPVADLKQEPYWQPVDGTRWFAWALILFGWGLGTAVIAGLMRLFNRN